MLEIKSRHLTWVGPKCIKKIIIYLGIFFVGNKDNGVQ